MKKLIGDYHDVFSKDEYDLGYTDKISHRIKLKHSKPIHILNNLRFLCPIRK